MFYKLKFENEDGLSIEFKAEKKNGVFIQPNSPAGISFQGYKLITFDDGGGANISLSKSHRQDGSTHMGTTLGERFPYIEFIIVADNYTELSRLRRKAIQLFNPKKEVTITMKYENDSFSLKTIPEQFINFLSEDKGGRSQVGTISLVSPSPFWESTEVYGQEIVSWIGGLTFPLELPTEFSTKGESTINIINKGDAETPVEITVSGRATNPKITNKSTGEFIKINRKLQEGDGLKITTDFGRKRVEQNGISVFNYIDLQSTFFQLQTGDNILEMTTDDVNDLANIKISYHHRYIGV